MQERLYRLRFVPKKLPKRGYHGAKQSCGHRLFKMYGMRSVYAKMSAKVHKVGGISVSRLNLETTTALLGYAEI